LKSVFLFAAAALAAHHPAPAQDQAATAQQAQQAPDTPPEPAIFTGTTLHQACAPANAPESTSGNICRAYILGAVDALLHLQIKEDRYDFCFPAGLAGRDVTGPFVEYLDRHPEVRSRPAAALVREHMIGRFPCREKPTANAAEPPAEVPAGTPMLGVQVSPVTQRVAAALGVAKAAGAVVVAIFPGTDAGRRLRGGDAILALNGEQVADHEQLTAAVRRQRAGERVRLRIWRDGREREVLVRLVGAPPAAEAEARLGRLRVTEGRVPVAGSPKPGSLQAAGMTFRSATPEEMRSATELGQGHQAVSIVEVVSGSDAQAAGIYAEDLLVEIDRRPLGGAEHAAQLLREASSRRRPVLLKLQRYGSYWYTALNPPQP
jgi:hypothetical protein